MTSEVDALKTNEFLRRRKLRIQQVREQSKDIAKKIRQRANSEKFRQLISIDATKEREYLEQQDKLIKKLEQLHAKSIGNFGASHKKAAEASQEENNQEKVDLSKQRAREATAQLRREKQEKLDERKKLLDRKLHAREIANEISREKSLSIANKLSKSSVKDIEETESSTKPATVPEKTTSEQATNEKDNEKIATHDMATQWGFESWPNEWEPNVPNLCLPKHDNTPKETTSRTTENHSAKSAKSKRLNLFAVSEEMPSSLRGGLTKQLENTNPYKPPLTLVSDYIQNRDLRLREFDSKPYKRSTGDCDPKPSKRSTEDLQKLKMTILRSRSSKAEGSFINPVHVADGHMVPVPSWQPETSCCGRCSHNLDQIKHKPESRQFNSITNSQINSIFSSIRPRPDLQPTPVLRESSPFKRNKVWPGTFSAKSTKSERPTKPESLENVLGQKSSVTIYNHSTRDIRDVPYVDQRLVSRDHQPNEDAYSQAMKETSSEQTAKDKDHQKKLQDMRSKIAVTKQSVEKEYKDTMAFLNSLPKENTKPLRNVYKDAHQEQIQLEHKQKKLQHEYRKIQKECRKQAHLTTRSVNKAKFARTRNSDDERDDFDSKDLQYSWMPVPESDQGLAVHIIPTKIKDQKSGNSVKFSKIDSYHEYRSRHKHTPPTKDTPENQRQKVFENPDMDTSTSSTIADASSVEDLRLGKDKKGSNSDKGSDTERIIIYKILDTKSGRKKKKYSRCSAPKSLNFVNMDEKKHNKNVVADALKEDDAVQLPASDNAKTVDHESNFFSKQLKEGVYKSVSKNGDNISSAGLTDEQKQNCPTEAEAYNIINRTPQHAGDRGSECISKETLASQSAHSASGSSFRTAATNNKTTLQQQHPTATNDMPSGGYVKVVDQNGQESGKFFIGATGFLKDDAYEVTIKLRKTDTTKADKKDGTNNSEENIKTVNQKSDHSVSVQPEKIHATTSTDVAEQEIKTVNVDANIQATALPKRNNLVDKGINVPLENSFISKQPGNSVSVQTSLDSPEPRYHRMSSSTSTAYMSPPEVILPSYLRHDDYIEGSHFNGTRNPKVYMVNHGPQLYQKRTSPRPKPNLLSPTKRVQRGKKLNTPPNTARSMYSPCTKKNIPLTITVPKIGKKKCRKRICSNTCPKSNIQETKGVLSSHLLAPPPSANNTNSQNSRTDGFNVEKHDMNPLVKQYVDKLLHMNKEGIKAINVENQDCSSVTTPGSSIIDDPNNINKKKEFKTEPKISLEQLKQLIAQHVVKKIAQDLEDYEDHEKIGDTGPKMNSVKPSFCFSKKRSVHKVKSLNISRSLLSKKSSTRQKPASNALSSCPVSRQSPLRDDYEITPEVPFKQKHRSKSSPSPRRVQIENKMKHKTNSFEGINDDNKPITVSNVKKVKSKEQVSSLANNKKSSSELKAPSGSEDHEAVVSSWNYDYSSDSTQKNPPCLSLHSSTQTNHNIDEQISYIKMAEDKLQNMEKIADLTEKCTQRLSNLAKVLEEVRKNKLSYSHASESASDTDQVSGKNSDTIPSTTYEPIIEIKLKETLSPPSEPIHSPVAMMPSSPTAKPDKEIEKSVKKHSPQLKRPKSPNSLAKTLNRSPVGVNTEHHLLKSRGKPPPALMRRCLKRTQEYIVPHELSTVVEIDSPISTKYNKSQSAQQNTKCEASIDDKSEEVEEKSKDNAPIAEEVSNNPDLVDINSPKQTHSKITEDPAEDSKIKMMDIKQFNDIMLRPFISIQEYAKQCNMTKLEDGSNIETLLRGDVITDELSSLHSDGSLPDVIAELLKRNIISEPFKFDTASNINSTTVSSDSTLSVLALSKVKKGKKRIKSPFSNKANMEESSDTLSASSNPDLEKAFKKLGMGWASSTLKKTKEHLALSSSSTNTSSSSLTQFKLKTVNSKDFPVLVTDSMSSIRNATNVTGRNDPSATGRPVNDDGKKAASQQTSVANSLTVKQFLTNELAKRITFGDRSHTKDTEEEFVSLCETKMPEEMQRTPNREDRSIDSNPRARTSTPVQIYKSMTYHSSSSSNVSNGLFSNADDLSSVKGTSNSMRNRSTSEKDDLTIPNFSLRTKKGLSSDYSRSDD